MRALRVWNIHDKRHVNLMQIMTNYYGSRELIHALDVRNTILD